jgi:hypothetical protein
MTWAAHCDRDGCDSWQRNGTHFLTLSCGTDIIGHFCCLDCAMHFCAASEPTEVV